jgi:IclR helix-turn-helix domain.
MKPSKLKSQRSKLEIHLDILKALATTAPLMLTQIEDQVKLNRSSLREKLGFLIKQEVVEQQTIEKTNIVFAITERGIAVLKYFKQYPQKTHVLEEI